MKKIINGKRYDTDTAEFVGEWENNVVRTDFYWYYEQLYRKRTGEYFLYGEGNAASPYSQAVGINSWAGSEGIEPITDEEAQEWAEEHLDADTVEKYFSVEDDAGEYVTTSLALPKAQYERLKHIARDKDVSMAKIVTWMIEEYK